MERTTSKSSYVYSRFFVVKKQRKGVRSLSINLAEKYQIMVDSKSFKKKPSEDEAPFLAERLKIGTSQPLTIKEALEHLTNGQACKFGEYEYQPTEEQKRTIKELMKQDRLSADEATAQVLKKDGKTLKSTRLIVIDIDDDLGASMPAVDLCKITGALALYYTSSHGLPSEKDTRYTQQAYRLIYVIDKPIDNVHHLKKIQECLKESIESIEPRLITLERSGKQFQGIDTMGAGMVYGSQNKNYFINEKAEMLCKWQYLSVISFENMTNKVYKFHDFSNKGFYSDNDYLKAAKYLGDTTGRLSYQEWQTMVIGIWVASLTGEISEQTALEIIQITDGYNQKEAYYMRYKPNHVIEGQATIATFIHHAREAGYKFPRSAEQPDEAHEIGIDPDKVAQYKIDKYVPSETILDLLNNDKKNILITAPTGAGKTQALINASKAYLDKNKKTIVYIASPTISLSEQISARINNDNAILKEKINVKKAIRQGITANERLFVGTYDKTGIFINNLPKDYQLVVMVDEAHKEVSDYRYRRKAIEPLFDLRDSDKTIKFLGFTGTPEEIDEESYELIVRYELNKPKNVAEALHILEYNETKQFLPNLTSLITHEIRNGARVLCFLNNKEMCADVDFILEAEGYKTAIINAENRQSKTYRQLMDNEAFDNDVNCIISTIALSDGISIQNKPNDVCIIAPSAFGAPFHNLPLITQSVHRFRNKYEKIVIPIYINKEDSATYHSKEKASDEVRAYIDASEKEFYFEWNYQRNLAQSENICRYLGEEFKDKINLISAGTGEKLFGIYSNAPADFDFEAGRYHFNNLNNPFAKVKPDERIAQQFKEIIEAPFKVNRRFVRYKTSQDKELYYKFHPFAFIKQLRNTLPVDETTFTRLGDYLTQATDYKLFEEFFKEGAKLKAEDNKYKLENGLKLIDSAVYFQLQNEYFTEGVIREDTKIWQTLKDGLHNIHYSALKGLIELNLEYETVMKILNKINNSSKTHEFKNRREMLIEIDALETFKKHQKPTFTSSIYEMLKVNFDGKAELTSKMKDDTLDIIKKETKSKRGHEAVDRIFKWGFIGMKPKSVRIDGETSKVRAYKLLTKDDFKTMFDLTDEEMSDVFQKNME